MVGYWRPHPNYECKLYSGFPNTDNMDIEGCKMDIMLEEAAGKIYGINRLLAVIEAEEKENVSNRSGFIDKLVRTIRTGELIKEKERIFEELDSKVHSEFLHGRRLKYYSSWYDDWKSAPASYHIDHDRFIDTEWHPVLCEPCDYSVRMFKRDYVENSYMCKIQDEVLSDRNQLEDIFPDIYGDRDER